MRGSVNAPASAAKPLAALGVWPQPHLPMTSRRRMPLHGFLRRKLLESCCMNSGVTERGTPLARARAVRPRIRAAADEIDEGRRIPTPLADELIDLGMFRLLVPQALGGEQMDWLDYLDVIRTIAYADASVGWSSIRVRCLPPQAAGRRWLWRRGLA